MKLFGKFSLCLEGPSAIEVKSERLQSLIAFLLIHREAPKSRNQIAFQLWPDVGDADAKANLRRRLHDLKKLLPDCDRYLHITTKNLQWIHPKECWSDIGEFESILAQVKPLKTPTESKSAPSSDDITCELLERAATLYQGELLPTCYDDWIVPYRDQFRQQVITVLDAIIPQFAQRQNLRSAIGYAQQLQRIDPLYEPAYCHLMRLHAQEGDRASALRVYHQCMTLLQDELGVPPSPTTYQIYEQLLALENSPPKSSNPDKAKIVSSPSSLHQDSQDQLQRPRANGSAQKSVPQDQTQASVSQRSAAIAATLPPVAHPMDVFVAREQESDK